MREHGSLTNAFYNPSSVVWHVLTHSLPRDIFSRFIHSIQKLIKMPGAFVSNPPRNGSMN